MRRIKINYPKHIFIAWIYIAVIYINSKVYIAYRRGLGEYYYFQGIQGNHELAGSLWKDDLA